MCHLSLPRKDRDHEDFNQRPSVYNLLTGTIPPCMHRAPVPKCSWSLPRRTPAIAYVNRWLAHFANRVAYERAMLAESGGTEADKKGL